ncbi:MAG: outer membrane beta-barrel protein [Bacteroidota bacterium]
MKKTIVTTLLILNGISILHAQESTQVTKEKPNQLNEIAIVKEKKAVEQKADRTIFDFASQAHLNSGSVMEGIKKLPGLIASDMAGMMYQGKQLDVYLDGRPLNISSNELNAFLEGMPANSVERIEVITQPGAEFPATSGGAILNIITNKKAKNYLTATYTNSTNVTNYDTLRWRTNNSLMLSSKNKLFGWQLSLGQNYAERGLWTNVTKNESNVTTILSKNEADRINRNTFAKSALTFDLGEDRLLLNYDIIFNKNTSYTSAFGTLQDNSTFETFDKGNTKSIRQDAVVTYQKRFTDKTKKLDFRFNFNRNTNDFDLNSITNDALILDNISDQKVYNFKADYSQPLKLLDEGKMSFGTLYEELIFDTQSSGVTNLEYKRRTASTYLEFQAKYKKFDFILGGRAEDYDITGKTATDDLMPFKQFRFFPNASVQYSFIKQVGFTLNYNKKITLPSTTALNPNNTNYQNPNVEYAGNPQLQPAIFDNYEAKISAFDYAFVGYNLSVAKNQVVTRVTLDNNSVTNTSINVSQIKVHNFNIGLPIPFMVFTTSIKEMMKFNFNPDKMNMIYVYAGRQKHEIPDVNTKAFWGYNLMAQLILPKEVRFVANYSHHISSKGSYYYFVAQKPINESLDLSFTKKFLKDQLTLSVNFDDVLNSNRSFLNSYNTSLFIKNKFDTRRFGFTINYKIPTKNKLAKEDPNMLNKEKKEDNGGVIGN